MKVLTLVLVLFSLSSFAIGNKAIHGRDDRHEVSSYPNEMFVNISSSIVGMVSKKKLRKSIFKKDYYTFRKKSLKDAKNLCESDKFSHQSVLTGCSGFLVTEDTIITAGHCVRRNNGCSGNYWVFDYYDGVTKIKKNNVYKCKKMIVQKFDELRNEDDYAIIKLDRKVKGRTPVNLDLSGNVDEDTPIVMVGHPTMLPMKITDGAKVISTSRREFSTNLDIFEGNSGSAVFNEKTGKVIGIAVRAVHGYKKVKNCWRSVKLLDSESRDSVLKLGEIEDIVNYMKTGSL